MSGTASVVLNASLNGGTTSSKAFGPTTYQNTNANEQTTSQAVLTNTVITVPTVPTQATGVLIIPPTNNANVLTLKGVAGDTGIPISPTSPTFLPFAASPPASFVMNASLSTNIDFWWV